MAPWDLSKSPELRPFCGGLLARSVGKRGRDAYKNLEVVQELNDVLEGDRKVRTRNDDLLARRHRCEERLRGWRWWFIWDEETRFTLIIACVA
jgi:hypothetical protein